MKKNLTKQILLSTLVGGLMLLSYEGKAALIDLTHNTVVLPSLVNEDSLRNEAFVIIGTYADEENAIKHVLHIKKEISSAGYFLNQQKLTYYVYAFKSKDKQLTLNRLHELRNQEQFKDVWFYRQRVSNVKSASLSTVTSQAQPKIEDSTEDSALLTASVETIQTPIDDKSKEGIAAEDEIPVLKASADLTNVAAENADKEMVVLKANTQPEVIPDNISLKSLDINEDNDSIMEDAPTLDAVDKLHTAKSGDVIIFNNLIFHRNAAILHKSSEKDLFSLLTYLNDNPASRIKIHGHTNGEFRGEIIKMGKRDKDYFVTSSKNEYVMGDEVLLSMERAKIIKKYLEEKGILEERLEIGGWGGQKTVYPANSEQAALNSRVEIEIL